MHIRANNGPLILSEVSKGDFTCQFIIGEVCVSIESCNSETRPTLWGTGNNHTGIQTTGLLDIQVVV